MVKNVGERGVTVPDEPAVFEQAEQDADSGVEFTELVSEDEVYLEENSDYRNAGLHYTDWTTETIIAQLERKNIDLNPQFQRRDAWQVYRKSRFIESLLLGLPIPQIVLAERKDARGKFIVLDGKQRLLSLLQFWGLGGGSEKNRYTLTGLEVRKDLNGKTLDNLKTDAQFEGELDLLLNETIRTVVIRNWPSKDFLHLVFLRLNTGSVQLSPQELRQALFPGKFSDWVDTAASKSKELQDLLNLKEPDYRMRDIELLARFLAFRYFLPQYGGRMKGFLDHTFEQINNNWDMYEDQLDDAVSEFEGAIRVLMEVFENKVGRKPESNSFNRAIFDFLSYYARTPLSAGSENF